METKLFSIISIFLISLLFLTSCTKIVQTEDKLSCNQDNDCICGGIDKETNNCYLGNKDYFNKNVNQSQDCPDFCTGIANNFETKCVENKCTHINKINNPIKSNSCTLDTDCMKAGCSGTLCISKSNQDRGFTTCEWSESYSCYKEQSCLCKNNVCAWSNQEKLNSCLSSY